jgi:hypothetical protein
VRLAFEMRAHGATLKQIIAATHLFPVVNSWKTFFNNRIYIGILKYGDLIIDDYCEPMVTVEVWDQVQAVNQRHAKITADYNPRRDGSSFLFSGLLHCQECGSLMNGRVIKGRHQFDEYYYCMSKDRGRTCHSRMIPARTFEQAIIAKLEDVALDLETLINFQARVTQHHRQLSTRIEGERKRLRRELVQQSKRIANLTDAIAERGISRALHTSLAAAELKEAALRVQLEQLEKSLQPPTQHTPMQLRDLAEEVKHALHGEDIHKKKHAIHMLTVRIVAERQGPEVNAVLTYVPNICVGSSAPTGECTVGIKVIIPKYSRAKVLSTV